MGLSAFNRARRLAEEQLTQTVEKDTTKTKKEKKAKIPPVSNLPSVNDTEVTETKGEKIDEDSIAKKSDL